MSIERLSTTPCWRVLLGNDGDEVHFPTAEVAHQFVAERAAEDGERLYPDPEELPVPCWIATCDGADCLAVECDDDGSPIHIPAYTRRHALSELQELARDDSRLLCADCTPLVPAAPVSARPPILTELDLGRVFAAVVLLLEERTQPMMFDLDTHNVLATIEGLVDRTLTKSDGWAMNVRPFAVQMPLPGMPNVTRVPIGEVDR